MAQKNKEETKLLEVKSLNKIFVAGNSRVHAVNDVSFELKQGETIGLIGESGSGKTTIGRTIIRLNDPTSGQVILKGTNIGQKKMSRHSTSVLRHNIQMIFQDPYSSLNEQMNIMSIIAEPIKTLKLDKKYVAKFTDRYDNMIEFYKYFMTKKIAEFKRKNAIENQEFIIVEYEKLINRLKTFEVTSDNKWEEVEALIAMYYNVKIEGNMTVTNNNLTVSKNILSLWSETQNELNEGKMFSAVEQKMKDLEDKIAINKQQAKHVAEYFEYKNNYKTVKTYNKLFNDYLDGETKSFNGTVKGLVTILKDQALDIFIKSKEAENIKDRNFALLESQIKKMIVFALKSKGKAIYSTDIIERSENFEKRTMVKLAKIQKDIKIQSAIATKGFDITIDDQTFNFEKEWSEIVEKVTIDEHVIVKDFISKSKQLLKELTLKQRNYIDKFPKENPTKMDEQEKSLKAKANELKSQKSDSKFAEVVKDLEEQYKKASDLNETKKQEWLVTFELKQSELEIIFESNLKKLTDKVEQLVGQAKELFESKKQLITSADIEWFKNEEFKKPEVALVKKTKKMETDLAKRNKMLEAESKRVLKEVEMLHNIVTGGRFRKKVLKEYLIREKVFEVLEEAGLTKAHAFRYPHEFSGGMRQRVGIARAIVSQPDIIIADEPIAALDLSIQAQIANLLKEMQDKRKMSMIFIAHDLSMVKHISDRILIIHLGRIVESGTTSEIFNHPVHPYTKNLIKSMPDISRISKGFENNNFNPEYLKEYSLINAPEYINIKGTHEVLATKAQYKQWM